MALEAAVVEEIFRDCLSENADSVTALTVEGIVHTVALDRAKLADYHAQIGELLAELPIQFMSVEKGGGGGWSFLNACNDRDGNQWTGLHLTMEQLFLLGIATGQAKILLAREIWEILPGGMPYIEVTPD